MKLKIAAVYGKHDSISMRSIPIVGYDLHTFVLRAQIGNYFAFPELYQSS